MCRRVDGSEAVLAEVRIDLGGGQVGVTEELLDGAEVRATVEEVGWEIFQFILETASGRRKTWAEHWGLANALSPFNPGPVT